MRIGVMGGTFDPIHLGHTAAAASAATQLGLDLVLFVPAGQPWMKQATPQASAEDRFRMVELAVRFDDRFRASRVDIDRRGPTYTVDTLADLQAAHAHQADQWYLFVGADALADLPRWRSPERVLAMAHLVGLTRPGHRLAMPALDVPGLPAASFTLLDVPAVDVSSTTIRAMVRAGASIDGLVDDLVATYIADHSLYRDAP